MGWSRAVCVCEFCGGLGRFVYLGCVYAMCVLNDGGCLWVCMWACFLCTGRCPGRFVWLLGWSAGWVFLTVDWLHSRYVGYFYHTLSRTPLAKCFCPICIVDGRCRKRVAELSVSTFASSFFLQLFFVMYVVCGQCLTQSKPTPSINRHACRTILDVQPVVAITAYPFTTLRTLRSRPSRPSERDQCFQEGNEEVLVALEEAGGLLAREAYQHKYPYDWRTKKPTIFRATDQWFASVDRFRDAALSAIKEVCENGGGVICVGCGCLLIFRLSPFHFGPAYTVLDERPFRPCVRSLGSDRYQVPAAVATFFLIPAPVWSLVSLFFFGPACTGRCSQSL